MRTAYIAGPYRPRGIWKRVPVVKWLIIAWNIHRARKVALRWWRAGYAVIVPHGNTAFFDGRCPDSVWLSGDLEIMRRCDVVVMMPDWERSGGAVAEHVVAVEYGLEIVYA